MAISSEILGEMSTRFGKSSGYTHPGAFTADDVLCSALCRVMNPGFEVHRTDTMPDPLDLDYMIFYNYRTEEETLNLYNAKINKEYRSDQTRYGTFGLMWRDFGPYIILPWDKTEADRKIVEFMVDQFDEEYILPLDVARINGANHPWIEMIENFNFIPNEATLYQTHMDVVMYDRVLEFTTTFLERLCEKYKMACNAMVKIYEDYNEHSSDMEGIVYLDDEIEIDTDWALEFVREHMDGIYYMIRPSEVRGYNIHPVKKTAAELAEKFPNKTEEQIGLKKYKIPLPAEWNAQRPEYLNDIYTGLFFCQSDGSMAVTETYEAAVLITKNQVYAYNSANESSEG